MRFGGEQAVRILAQTTGRSTRLQVLPALRMRCSCEGIKFIDFRVKEFS
jgi:hypothetical protein